MKLDHFDIQKETLADAAPQLYEALKEYVDYLEHKPDRAANNIFYKKMKQALLKAEGKL